MKEKKCKYCNTTENLVTGLIKGKTPYIRNVCVNCYDKWKKESSEKRKKTNLEKYGSEVPLQNEEIKNKAKQTNLEKYGTEWGLSNKDIINKREETNIKKYGVKNPMQNKEIYEKTKQTNLERYGVENLTQNKEIKEKVKNTMIKRYGTEYALQNEELKNKQKETNLERYGVKNPLQNAEIRDKQEKTVIKLYGVKNVFSSKEIKNKIKNTNIERYGCENPNQNIEIHKKSEQTNLKKYGVKNPLQSEKIKEKIKKTNLERYGFDNPNKNIKIKEKSIKTFRQNHYKTFLKVLELKGLEFVSSKKEYINFENELEFKCLKCNKVFKSNNTNPQKIYCGCLVQRSSYELEICGWLNSIGITNIETNKRDFSNKSNYEADIFLPDYNLAIDFHGIYWHSNLYVEDNYHKTKYNYFKDLNIPYIQIFETEWLNKKSLVKSIIQSKLGLNEKIYARKCKIKELKNNEYNDFLILNHIQGIAKAKIKVGLFYNDELVALMSFSSGRFRSNNEYEMIRFCNLTGTSVIGGFNKLLKYFENTYTPKELVSFVNLRYFSGGSYKDFKLLETTKPNYFYFKNAKEGLQNRIKYQKHKLKDLLDKFDSTLTEKENMLNNGYLYIHDAGNLKFSKKYL